MFVSFPPKIIGLKPQSQSDGVRNEGSWRSNEVLTVEPFSVSLLPL